MSNSTRKMLVKAGAILLALLLVTSASVLSRNTALRATDEMMEAGFEAPAEEVVVEEPIYEPAPEAAEEENIIVSEEIDSDEIPENEETEPAEEEKVEDAETEAESEEKEETPEEEFDVEKAYEFYMSLETSEERAGFLAGLSEANRAELIEYIRMREAGAAGESEPVNEDEKKDADKDKEEKEKKEPAEHVTPTVSIRFEDLNGGELVENDTVRIYADVENPDGAKLAYRWQYDAGDGKGWQDAGGFDTTYDFEINDSNYMYNWRVLVDWFFD